MAVGSSGDVIPYTGLGARLRAAGHHVAVAAAAPFADTIRAAGLEFRPLPGDPRAAQHSEANQRWQRGGGGLRGGARLVKLLSEAIAEVGQGMIKAARAGCDVILLSGPAFMGGADVAEGVGVPSVGVFAAPGHPTGEFPPPLGLPSLGPRGNHLAWRALQAGMSSAMSGAVTQIRGELGLPARSFRRTVQAQDAAGWPVLYGVSPTVLPRPRDWRRGLEIVGYFWPHLPDTDPPAELVAFLETGPPPVVLGFGSMVPGDPDKTAGLIQRAVRRAGVRAVVQSGWAGLEVHGDDVLTVGAVPHEWLLPRAAAVVHHCGAGTTAAALRAGVPTVPVPVAADQPFWAARQQALGVCPAVLPARRLDSDHLGDAIAAAVGCSRYRERAGEVAARIALEDGSGRVVEAVDALAPG